MRQRPTQRAGSGKVNRRQVLIFAPCNPHRLLRGYIILMRLHAFKPCSGRHHLLATPYRSVPRDNACSCNHCPWATPCGTEGMPRSGRIKSHDTKWKRIQHGQKVGRSRQKAGPWLHQELSKPQVILKDYLGARGPHHTDALACTRGF
jgi:hypothetical protein